MYINCLLHNAKPLLCVNSALSNEARDELYKNYPHAKLGHLKSGGNFPYLSRSDEVNMHILVRIKL